LDDRAEFCRQLAQDAGRLAHTAFGTSPASMKGRHDVLTAMDGQVERFIRQAIAQRYPDDAVLGEEEGASAGLPGRAGSGSSIRSTAPQTTRAASRTTASPSACCTRACRSSARCTTRATSVCTAPNEATVPG
jgi:3'-phosphoadenosine 5'-phosphosulfate (PAPS) 3'-phosphatase